MQRADVEKASEAVDEEAEAVEVVEVAEVAPKDKAN